MRNKFFLYLAGCTLAACLSVPVVVAQTVTGSITGEVTDPSGAVIPNAKVTAQNVDTGVKTQVSTNDAGVYSIRFLPIGHYQVVVDAEGFSSQTVPPFTLETAEQIFAHHRWIGIVPLLRCRRQIGRHHHGSTKNGDGVRIARRGLDAQVQGQSDGNHVALFPAAVDDRIAIL